ncbi:MAG: FHA domain-containing protein [Candidatus Xenobiia bacterium LiM19]
MIFNSGFQIEVLEGADRGKKIPLKSRELTLGRKLIPNERITHWILFNEPTVSRIHAVLIWNDETKEYDIHHKSKTNPTLVNTLPVAQKRIIQEGDKIQMGLLVFKVTHESSSLESPAETEKVDFSFLLEKDERPLDGGLYYLEVTEGEDRGKTFPLTASRHVMGRLQGSKDAEENEILLNEHYIPEEHIFLHWNSREGKYGAIKSDHSPLTSQVRRAADTMETVTDITSQRQVLLDEGDDLLVGTTVLRVRKENALIENESSSAPTFSDDGTEEGAPLPAPVYFEETAAPQLPAAPVEEETSAPLQSVSPAEEETSVPPYSASPAEEETSAPQLPAAPAENEETLTPPVGEKVQNEPLTISIMMEESMRFKSIPLDFTEKPKMIPMVVDEAERPRPPQYAVTEDDIDAAFEHVKSLIDPDYELSILAGPDRGNHISFLRRDLREGKSIRLGRRQCIFNDIQLQDEQIGEVQATFFFKRGRFHIRNDNRDTPLYLNGDPVSSRDETELSSGDTLTCGDTVMVLRDRKTAFRPGEYIVEVTEGEDSDRGKAFELNRETVTIGRAAHCDIVLSDPDIKSIHAAITCKSATFIVQQLSEDGVMYLNGVSIMVESPRELHPGDLVRLSSRSSLVFSRKQRC